jgi:ATP-dependent helicase HrpA
VILQMLSLGLGRVEDFPFWSRRTAPDQGRLRLLEELGAVLRLVCRQLGLAENHEAASEEALHRAVLAGMITHIGVRTEERDYEGVRSRRFLLHPGSALFRKPPKWVVCAELVETTRLYARGVAAIEPEWVLQWAADLVKREHHSPCWQSRSGKVMASERIRLFGLVLSDQRSVDYGKVDPLEARRIFIQSALVEGDYHGKQRFWRHNRALLAEVEALEAKGRRRDLLVQDQVIHDFYEERLPAQVHDHPSLEKWLREILPRQPDVLCMQRETLLRKLGDEVPAAQFPDELCWQELRIPLQYRYEPGHADDGVTAVVPLALLDHLPRHLCEWLVPGLLRDKLIAMLKSLPKQYRKPLVPVPDTVDALLAMLRPRDEPLGDALSEALRRERGVAIPREAWQEQELDPFYRMNLRVVDRDAGVVAQGRDMHAIRLLLGSRARAEVQRAAPAAMSRSGLTCWDFGALPPVVRVAGAALDVPGYPALKDCGDSVAIETCPDSEEAALMHRAGLRRLLLLESAPQLAWLRRNLLRDARIGLRWGARFDRLALIEDLLLAAVDACIEDDAPLPRDQAAHGVLLARVRKDVTARAQELEQLLERMAEQLHAIQGLRAVLDKPAFAEPRRDIEQQLAELLAPGFLWRTPAPWRARLPLYLKGIAARLDKLSLRLPRDIEAVRELAVLDGRLREYLAAHRGSAIAAVRACDYRWMLQEYRISLFAQQLGTLSPVSRKRLDRIWDELRK